MGFEPTAPTLGSRGIGALYSLKGAGLPAGLAARSSGRCPISDAIDAPIGRERDWLGRSHSCSFDQRRRPETLRTAMAMAFFCPTRTTSRLPRVTPV